MVIRSTFTNLPKIVGVYGFGSYFRGSEYNDIDILVVSDADCSYLLDTYRYCQALVDCISSEIGITVDITFFTVAEFEEKQLIEMDSLTVLYERYFEL